MWEEIQDSPGEIYDMEDFKARVEIHNYEVNKLGQDIQFIFDYLMDEVYFKVVTK